MRPTATLDRGTLLTFQERERALVEVLRRSGYRSLEGVRIFEAGAGNGYNLLQFVQWGAHPGDLGGIELDAERAEYARSHLTGLRMHTGSAEQIPEEDQSFDICVAFRLFSSLHNEERSEHIAAEMFRVTRAGGLLLVYDIRRKRARNRDVQSVHPDDIHRWFPKCRAHTEHLSLGSKTGAVAARIGTPVFGALSLLPPLRTHSLHIMQRPATSAFGDEEAWEAPAQTTSRANDAQSAG